jgi:RNA polymerase sigma factor (sigma-70 family)
VGPTDTSLRIRGAVAGDRDDLGWTIERLTPLLLAQARYRMRDRLLAVCDPEDVVAHAWQVTLPRLPDLVPRDGRLGPVLVKFLATAVLLRVNELLRIAARRAIEHGASGSVVEQAADPGTGAATRAAARERHELVQRSLDALDAADRDVIVLRLVEQRPAAEVAGTLGLTANAVHVRLHRALARLRTALPASAIDDLAAETAAGDD